MSNASYPSAHTEEADARLLRVSLQADSSTVEARVWGRSLPTSWARRDGTWRLTPLAVLAAAFLAGADLALAALALKNLKPASGRGAAHHPYGSGRKRAAHR